LILDLPCKTITKINEKINPKAKYKFFFLILIENQIDTITKYKFLLI